MSRSGTSTVSSFDALQRFSVYLPHLLYGSTTCVDARYVSCAIIVSFATSLVVFASYATVSQPQSAQNPALGKEDPLYDQTDTDDSSFVVAPTRIGNNDPQSGAHYYCHYWPFIYVGNTVLNRISQEYGLSDVWIEYMFCAGAMLMTHPTVSFVLDSLARQAGHFFGLKGNSGFFFKRFRVTLSKEEKMPLGLYGRFDRHALGMSKSEFKRYRKHMARVNNVKLIKMTNVPAKKQFKFLVADTKVLISVPVAVALTYFSYVSSNWLLYNVTFCCIAVFHSKSLSSFRNFQAMATILGVLNIYDFYTLLASGSALTSTWSALGSFVFPHKPSEILTLAEISTRQLGFLEEGFDTINIVDISIPATLISLCLHFDYYQFYKENRLPFHRLRSIGVPKYFTAAVMAYAFATSCAVGVSAYTQKQPSIILFAVPMVFAAVAGLAWTRNELHSLWNYSELVMPVREVPKKEAPKREEKQSVSKEDYGQEEINLVADDDFQESVQSDDEPNFSDFIEQSDDSDLSEGEDFNCKGEDCCGSGACF